MSPCRTPYNEEEMYFTWHNHIILRQEWLKALNTIGPRSKEYENSRQFLALGHECLLYEEALEKPKTSHPRIYSIHTHVLYTSIFI
jgi:hypothetical protein